MALEVSLLYSELDKRFNFWDDPAEFHGPMLTIYPIIGRDCPYFFLTGNPLHFMAESINVYTSYLTF